MDYIIIKLSDTNEGYLRCVRQHSAQGTAHRAQGTVAAVCRSRVSSCSILVHSEYSENIVLSVSYQVERRRRV